ncbi:MAG: metal-dependent transcriptional regulator [Candidatus Tectomicrobia bacterium]|uniref:Transcriptional regulator MntR n=1 Tax=Tectimicrobiota bacterium TaxID=2528274 RepID=A0A932I139_UNCTE|nr:metal-dependent transcriptional regulator [Candidatus Tectomicrobia bacterium]
MPAPRLRVARDLSPSLEHYLRAIYDLELEKGYARVTDIAERLGVAKPAVSVALRSLRGSGLVDHRAYESVHLTEDGKQRAKGVSGKFSILHHFLIEVLGVREEQAFMDACLMEHYVSPTTMDRLLDLLRFFEREDKQEILEAFRAYRRSCESDDSCPTCSFHCDIVVQGSDERGKQE